MGKAQSKRSVDITTDPKKDGIIEEGTGEMKKIEDADQLKINGDTHHNETEEKKESTEAGETENEKDLSTEKEQQKITQISDGACGDVAAVSEANEVTVGDKSATDADETLNDSKSADSAENSSKKLKKEKVKKKWSFRSISFGKKDKQKPTKKEDAAANTSAANGECEKVPEEVTEEQAPATIEKKEEDVVTTSEPEQPSEEAKSQPAEKPLVEEVPKAEVAEESTTNGTTVEEKKEENASPSSPVIEKCEEPVSAQPEQVQVESPVADNISEAVVTNGDKHVEENGTSVPTMNGSTESPKTEVKEELLVEQEHINTTTTTTAIIVDNIEQKNIIEEKIKETTTVPITTTTDGDSEIKLPPPPLPCTLPPSQVMVFALSETASNEQKDDKSPSNLSPTDIPFSESSDPSQVVENTVALETITKDNEGIEVQKVEEIITEDKNQSNQNLTQVEDKNLETPVVELEKSIEVVKEITSSNENDVQTKTEIDDINCKVDENKILNEQKNDIVETNPIEESETKKINEIILNDIVVEEIKPNNIEIIQNQISSETVQTEVNKETTIVDNESIKIDSVEIDSLKENINEIHSDINDDLPPPPPTPPELKLSMQDIQNGNKNDDIVDAITEKLNDVNLNSNENIILAATQEQHQQHHQNKKENGVGEIHEQNNEISATENLNGGEHKTIEEIKAENQQIEKSATEITQEAAVTAE